MLTVNNSFFSINTTKNHREQVPGKLISLILKNQSKSTQSSISLTQTKKHLSKIENGANLNMAAII